MDNVSFEIQWIYEPKYSGLRVNFEQKNNEDIPQLNSENMFSYSVKELIDQEVFDLFYDIFNEVLIHVSEMLCDDIIIIPFEIQHFCTKIKDPNISMKGFDNEYIRFTYSTIKQNIKLMENKMLKISDLLPETREKIKNADYWVNIVFKKKMGLINLS